MTERPFFAKAVVSGVGLLGASVGLALKRHGLASTVVGLGRNAERLEIALSLGAIDSYETDLSRACQGADLVVLATPVCTILEQLPLVLAQVSKGCLVTDVGSTKSSITRCASEIADPQGIFIGSHPMAGSERSGAQHAEADLFENATILVTPDPETPNDSLERLCLMWEIFGGRILQVSPCQHDYLVASLSHLPHIVASALVAQLDRQLDAGVSLLKEVAGPGFRDTTRIAMGSVPMWTDICLDNRQALSAALDNMIGTLIEIRSAIENQDRDKLGCVLNLAAELRKQFQA